MHPSLLPSTRTRSLPPVNPTRANLLLDFPSYDNHDIFLLASLSHDYSHNACCFSDRPGSLPWAETSDRGRHRNRKEKNRSVTCGWIRHVHFASGLLHATSREKRTMAFSLTSCCPRVWRLLAALHSMLVMRHGAGLQAS
jgi:hypothetical protein